MIQSADVLINWDTMKNYSPDTPGTSIAFNTCTSTGDYYPYSTIMHEAGHALGLSAADIGEIGERIFNDFRSAIHGFIGRYFHLVPIVGDLIVSINSVIENTIGELSETVYEASHPSIADSVMNYWDRIRDSYLIANDQDSADRAVREPDCWPHPFDIMAINSLYQADYP